jgi:hypothetical protein
MGSFINKTKFSSKYFARNGETTIFKDVEYSEAKAGRMVKI